MVGLFVRRGLILLFLESVLASIRMSCHWRCVVSKTPNELMIESYDLCDNGKTVSGKYTIKKGQKQCLYVLDNASITIGFDVGNFASRLSSKELNLECSGDTVLKCKVTSDA